MTGEMIKEVLEQQFDNIGPGQDRILQVSQGFAIRTTARRRDGGGSIQRRSR